MTSVKTDIKNVWLTRLDILVSCNPKSALKEIENFKFKSGIYNL